MFVWQVDAVASGLSSSASRGFVRRLLTVDPAARSDVASARDDAWLRE